jgi:predicted nucleotidyltransferase
MEKEVKDIIDGIAKKFSPNKIILFGSRARGTNRKDSDIDLLVLFDKLESAGRKTKEMYMNMDAYYIPLDLIVTSKSNYEQRKNIKSEIYYAINKEGVVIYEI